MNKVDYEENGWHSPPTVLFVPIFNNRSKNSLTSIGTPLKNYFYTHYIVD